MPCIILLGLQFLLIADLELAVPDSRYSHEYKDNKISVPKPNYFQCPNQIIVTWSNSLHVREEEEDFQLELG